MPNFAAQNGGGAPRPRIESIPNEILYWGAVSGGPGWFSRFSGPSGVAAPRNPLHSVLLRSVNQAKLDILAGTRKVCGAQFHGPQSNKIIGQDQFAKGSEPFGARQSYFKVASGRPNWIRNRCSLEWFCFCAGLLLWCWPPCFGQIDDESKKTFCEHHPRTQKLIISKPRGQKLQSQNGDFQTSVGLPLKFLATRL